MPWAKAVLPKRHTILINQPIKGFTMLQIIAFAAIIAATISAYLAGIHLVTSLSPKSSDDHKWMAVLVVPAHLVVVLVFAQVLDGINYGVVSVGSALLAGLLGYAYLVGNTTYFQAAKLYNVRIDIILAAICMFALHLGIMAAGVKS